MTVTEIFRKANLSPHGPVRWLEKLRGADGSDLAGVYVVARIPNPTVDCDRCDLPFKDPLPPDVAVDLKCEQRRLLPNESAVYIGQTRRTIQERIAQFYSHKPGIRSPHAGGQVVGLLKCELWVYWSPADDPLDSERVMIFAFKKQIGQEPFANANGNRGPKRARRSA